MEMTINDIITLLTVILAVIAIFNEKNRKHLLLKFHRIDYIIFCISFFLINYFVFYDSFLEKKLILRELYFNGFGFKNPKIYAYILTIAILFYLSIKIWRSFYPFVNLAKVNRFYQDQIEQQQIPLLLDMLERYHLRDINNMIDSSKDYDPNDNWWESRFEEKDLKTKIKELFTSSVRYLFPFSKANRYVYARYVLHGIINEPAFIILSANQRPYFFASIFQHFRKNKRDAFPNDMLKTYFAQWVNVKNFWLQKELRESQNHDSGQPEWFFEDNKIIASVLLNLDVAEVNEVWQPFGTAAREELEEERLKGYDSLLYLEFREDHHLWDFKVYFAIEFFYILIIEAIRARYDKSHFFLTNYWYIVTDIVKTLDEYPIEEEDGHIVYLELINQILSKSFHWLDLCNRYEHPSLYHDVLSCLGSSIAEICESSSIPENTKISAIDRVFRLYCSFQTKSETNRIRARMDEMLCRPSVRTTRGDMYYDIVEKAWSKFDKIPYRNLGGESTSFTRLKTNVIIPLGLNPDEF
ncbi:MAG: hypothetical protein H6549_09780 [Chitinophagales bacterium]|nr:hypothetical protein [Chitinophagales bacterium]